MAEESAIEWTDATLATFHLPYPMASSSVGLEAPGPSEPLVVSLARVILPGYDSRGWLLMDGIYFDDSGTHPGSRIVTYSSLLADTSVWASFEAEWWKKVQKPLPNKPRLRRFHMAACQAQKDEFERYSVPERDLVTKEFRDILLAFPVIGVACSIDVAAWDEIMTGRRREWHGSAEQECFSAVNALAIGLVSKHSVDKRAALVFDRAGPEREKHMAIIVELYRKYYSGPNRPTYSVDIHGPSFLSSYKVCALQAADMVAWESYRLAVDRLDSPGVAPRHPLQELIDSGRFLGAFLTRPRILEIAAAADAVPNETYEKARAEGRLF